MTLMTLVDKIDGLKQKINSKTAQTLHETLEINPEPIVSSRNNDNVLESQYRSSPRLFTAPSNESMADFGNKTANKVMEL